MSTNLNTAWRAPGAVQVAFSPDGSAVLAFSPRDGCLRKWGLSERWTQRLAKGPAILAASAEQELLDPKMLPPPVNPSGQVALLRRTAPQCFVAVLAVSPHVESVVNLRLVLHPGSRFLPLPSRRDLDLLPLPFLRRRHPASFFCFRLRLKYSDVRVRYVSRRTIIWRTIRE